MMIKKIALAGILTVVVMLSGFAQGKVEITPFGGYMFGGSVKFYEGKLKIEDNVTYGLALDFEVANDTKIGLFWSQMNTTADFRPYYGFEDLRIAPFDINVGYIQIGSMREIDFDNVVPFGSLTLGTTYFLPQNTRYKQTWKFSATLGGGAKIWFSDKVGIRLQGRLLMPMFWGGAGLSVGTGGAGISVGASTSMVQGDFTGGLIIALGG